MSYANWVKRRVAVAAAVAGVTVAAVWTVVAQAAPAKPAGPTGPPGPPGLAEQAEQAGQAQAIRLWLNLTPMPTGTVTTGTTPGGQQFVRIDSFGLTPGSAHAVTLGGKPIGTLTANGAGQAVTTFNVPAIRPCDRVWILNAGSGTSVIAVTPATTRISNGPYPLEAVEAGFPPGSLWGHATLVFDPAARTIAVTVTATGFTPGSHAAHIHLGSCSSQGAVKYMLRDFTADSLGNIDHETRVVTGVTALPAYGWYLNLHQGNRNNILNSSGQPTIFFRPLLCANV